jgi:hypothetical protein
LIYVHWYTDPRDARAADPGKTYVDWLMKGIELLLAELSSTGQKN